jgi:hypothetical protein
MTFRLAERAGNVVGQLEAEWQQVLALGNWLGKLKCFAVTVEKNDFLRRRLLDLLRYKTFILVPKFIFKEFRLGAVA